MENRFQLHAGADNSITVVRDGEKLVISISEEKAMDSCNVTFECSYTLSAYEFEKLLAFLIRERI